MICQIHSNLFNEIQTCIAKSFQPCVILSLFIFIIYLNIYSFVFVVCVILCCINYLIVYGFFTILFINYY